MYVSVVFEVYYAFMHINMIPIIDSTKHPTNLKECNCLPTCSMIEYEVTDTSNVDDWKYIKSINLVQNKYVLFICS